MAAFPGGRVFAAAAAMRMGLKWQDEGGGEYGGGDDGALAHVLSPFTLEWVSRVAAWEPLFQTRGAYRRLV